MSCSGAGHIGSYRLETKAGVALNRAGVAWSDVQNANCVFHFECITGVRRKSYLELPLHLTGSQMGYTSILRFSSEIGYGKSYILAWNRGRVFRTGGTLPPKNIMSTPKLPLVFASSYANRARVIYFVLIDQSNWTSPWYASNGTGKEFEPQALAGKRLVVTWSRVFRTELLYHSDWFCLRLLVFAGCSGLAGEEVVTVASVCYAWVQTFNIWVYIYCLDLWRSVEC